LLHTQEVTGSSPVAPTIYFQSFCRAARPHDHWNRYDFLLSAKRDGGAASRFFQKAVNRNGAPRVIALNAYAASHPAITELRGPGSRFRPNARNFVFGGAAVVVAIACRFNQIRRVRTFLVRIKSVPGTCVR